ncbi:unnamed protein product [Rotaria sp. Silwood2]|nr:unnamed protein product [Rotaria sp. Silwood2]CAF2734272.1 unnamed protein product [Rotaria sp. Silwood2]CAF3049256.1 unnamed protein product [Rotaria sp. Silwood2]CAF3125854.1 unnamed protein product [Rotaria sp. Silwood2]CAF4160213.1 unnamed protein product [Rotaria sp. Silwood2]
MADDQSSNDTEIISFASSEISLPRVTRFWMLLLFDVSSTICALFVLFCVLINHKLRSTVNNHALIVLLFLGLSLQLIDVPFYLNFIIHSSVTPSNGWICLLWWLVDIGMYNGGTIILAWIAFERHIIVFYDQLISTRKKRILIHYLPMLFLILYSFAYYIYATYYFPCENIYDYTLPFCNGSPCYLSDPIMGIWNFIINSALPSFLEAFFSLSFLFRVFWKKYHSHLPMQWRKQRKMTIQLMSLSSLNMAVTFPIGVIGVAHLCGLPQDVGVQVNQYFFFFSYFVIFLIPFICLASISGVNRKFQEKILCRRQRQVQRFTATVKPEHFKSNITMQH